MKAPVIRISIGKFDDDKAVIVEEKLRESRARLENGISAMNGNIAYYVGIDRSTNASTMSVFGRLSLTRTKWRLSHR